MAVTKHLIYIHGHYQNNSDKPDSWPAYLSMPSCTHYNCNNNDCSNETVEKVIAGVNEILFLVCMYG